MVKVLDISEQEPKVADSIVALTRAYRDAVRSSLQAQSAAAEQDVATLRQELQQLSRRFVVLDRRLLAQTRRGETLRDLDGIIENAGMELAQILAFPGVQGVEVTGQTLHVLTHRVQIAWAGERYQLGAYRIVLDLNGDLRIESVDKLGPKSGWDHPHVQDGRPCLGNAREGILKLVAEYELALAVQVATGFLETYQPDSAYCEIERWPRAHVDG